MDLMNIFFADNWYVWFLVLSSFLILVTIISKLLRKTLKFKTLFNNFLVIIFFVSLPLYLLCFIYILNNKNISNVSTWISFLGGYLAVGGAIFAIYLQMERQNKEKKKQIKAYIDYIVKENKKSFDKNLEAYGELVFENTLYTQVKVDNSKIKADFFRIISFDSKFIQNNIDYILTLKNGDKVLSLHNLLNELNDLYKELIEYKKSEDLSLKIFNVRSLFYKNLKEDFKKNSAAYLNNAPKFNNLGSSKIIRTSLSPIDDYYHYVTYNFLEIKNKSKQIFLSDKTLKRLREEIRFGKLEFEFHKTFSSMHHDFIKNLEQILEDESLLKSSILLEYIELFIRYQYSIFSTFDSLVLFNLAQEFPYPDFYKEFKDSQYRIEQSSYWFLRFNNLMTEFYNLLHSDDLNILY